MKCLLLATLLPLTLSGVLATTAVTLDPDLPIYLGDVFWPPSMTFIAWLPSDSSAEKLTEWCYTATDASNHQLFSLGGVDALQFHDYFGEAAYITREGNRFANCWVTPESGRMGACEGVLDYDCYGGQKFTGPGTRRWSCWVVEEERANLTRVEEEGEVLTDEAFKPTNVQTGAMASGSIMGAFTAGVTGV